MTSLSPFPNTYWVLAKQLLAGEHPTLLEPQSNRERIRGLLAAKISVFIDLTELEETQDLEPYLPILQMEASSPSAQFELHRLPIPDMSVPSIQDMVRALDLIDGAITTGRNVYVHCWGGIGRTGTLIGCYLVRHGMDGPAAIRKLADLRRHTPDYRYPAPAREIQRSMVCSWQPGC